MRISPLIKSIVAVALLLPGEALHAQSNSKAPATTSLADSLFASGDFAGAVREYEIVTKTAPAQPRNFLRLGQAAYNLKDYARAANAFEQAAAAGGGGIALYNAGAMHARLGHNDVAMRWLTRADSAGFIILNLLSTDTDLEELRKNPAFPSLVAKARRTAFPCETDPNAQRMNFWVGEWDVRNVQQQSAGTSSVQSVAGGCAVYENWTDRLGTQGKSLSTWNSARGQWQQFWVAQRGNVTEYRTGEWKNGSMVFVTEAQPGTNPPSLVRMTFTPVSSEIVRQMFENSTDEGRTWTVTSDLYYHRRKAP